MAEGRRNEQTADDQPRSLESPDFYTRQQSRTVINSSGSNQLDDSGIDLESSLLNQSTNVGRGDFEGRPTLEGASPAQTLATPNPQDLINLYSQHKSISRLTSEAEDAVKRYLQGGTGDTDIFNALQMGSKIFDLAVVLKRNSEDLMCKFQRCSVSPVVEETGTFTTPKTKMQTKLATTMSSYQPNDSQGRLQILPYAAIPAHPEEMLPLYDVNQHVPDTVRALESIDCISDDDVEMYDEESCSGVTSAASTTKEDTTWVSSFRRRLSTYREDKKIELTLVEHLLPLSKGVGVVKTYLPPEATIGAGVHQIRKQHAWGTCFRLGSKYVLTNKHVADMANLADCSNAFVLLNYYHQPPLLPIQFPIKGIKFACSDSNLDYAVLELDNPSHQDQGPRLGHLVQPLEKGQKVTVIGHQDGKPISMDASCPVLPNPPNWCEVIDIGPCESSLLHHPARATYRCTFSKGSSGSPVFNNNGHLVGMQTQGFPKVVSQIEQMIRMTAVRDDLSLHDHELCLDLFSSQ